GPRRLIKETLLTPDGNIKHYQRRWAAFVKVVKMGYPASERRRGGYNPGSGGKHVDGARPFGGRPGVRRRVQRRRPRRGAGAVRRRCGGTAGAGAARWGRVPGPGPDPPL